MAILCTYIYFLQNEKTMKKTFILFISICISTFLSAQTDANINGHVMANGKHLSFVNISLKGTTIGTMTDETGHYRLVNLPEGNYIIVAQSIGYKPVEKKIDLLAGKTLEVNFELKDDALGLEEVVVTGDRAGKSRKESSVIVNTLSPLILKSINAVSLSDGLNFTPGVRMENNCQNCGFSQVRMDGMEGSYSQILINGRPIFSALAGVYGLELIPANMLKRVEVIRGGGSALYGSNAIAGTINLILKDPIQNSYEFGVNASMNGVGVNGSGGQAGDYSLTANTSVVSPDNKTGMAIYGFHRERQPFDANNDGFSEMPLINNTTFGGRLFHRFGSRDKLSLDFFSMNEDRRGGDKFDYPEHEADIAESIRHHILTGGLTYDTYFRTEDKLSLFVSAQKIKRHSYYGANQSLKDYGLTNDLAYTGGAQYDAHFGIHKIIFGFEDNGETLVDKKLGYPDYDHAVIENDSIISVPHTSDTFVADQNSNTMGVFAQYNLTWNKLDATLGGRFDYYRITDNTNDSSDNAITGNVFSPRVTLKYSIWNFLQARVSYAKGYRAPQIFDEDLHIETSGSRQVIHKNDPNLTQETSHSLNASLDYNKYFKGFSVDFLLEGFYTRLNDAFVSHTSEPDANGVVVSTRTNATDGAIVKGVNMELNMYLGCKYSLKSGYTIQSSTYSEPQDFNEKRFFRTPNQYGYFIFGWEPVEHWGISLNGDYTGKMLVPYYGNTIANPDAGELRTSHPFFNLGTKLHYTFKINGASMQLFGGIKNMFNSYQNDFDKGADRDPGYIYGPGEPRSIYIGFKIGNFLR